MIPLSVTGLGAITPVGDDVRMTMASILGGVQLFDDLDVHGPGGRPVSGGKVPLSGDPVGLQRLSALGLLALRECVEAAPPAGALPVLLCLPEPTDLGCDPQAVLAGVLEDAGLPVDRQRSVAIAAGRVGVAAAVEQAARLCAAGAPGALLVAVDSLVSAARIVRLRRKGRLAEGPGGDGFVPAEGAVAVALAPHVDPRALAVLVGCAQAPEPRIPDSEAPVTGAGLTTAIRGALAAAPGIAPRALVHDASGPQAWFEELALARARPPLSERAPERLWGPALCTGELGAAAPALGIAIGAFFIAEGELDGPALTTISGDGGTRAATLLVPPAFLGRR
jgi:3-oxoacyl-[acyl-carrier-protein] synthase-1